MAQYFQLTPNGKDTPESFLDIDAKICVHLNVPCDAVKWYKEWYNIIGLDLACGQTWNQIQADCSPNDPLLPVIAYLRANYRVRAWAGR